MSRTDRMTNGPACTQHNVGMNAALPCEQCKNRLGRPRIGRDEGLGKSLTLAIGRVIKFGFARGDRSEPYFSGPAVWVFEPFRSNRRKLRRGQASSLLQVLRWKRVRNSGNHCSGSAVCWPRGDRDRGLRVGMACGRQYLDTFVNSSSS